MIKKQTYSAGQEIPIGLSMAMAQNPNALNHFSEFSQKKKQSVIDHAHTIHSKAEMKQFVDLIAHSDLPGNNSIF